LWYCGTKKYREGDGTGTVEKWYRGAAVVPWYRATLVVVSFNHHIQFTHLLYNRAAIYKTLILIQQQMDSITTIVRKYIFAFFLKSKKRDFYVFLKLHLKKCKKCNPKFEVSDFGDFSLHGISTAALKQCVFIIYMALVVA